MRTSPMLLAIAAALGGCSEVHHEEACMGVAEDQTTCPPGKDVQPDDLHILLTDSNSACGIDIVDVDSDGNLRTLPMRFVDPITVCCYTVMVEETGQDSCAVIGRPYFEGDRALRAPLCSPASDSLVASSPRADAWSAAGADEHASVAAFSRLALELMAHGAPTSLLRDVHQAALDEIGHAEICWSMARRFGGTVAGAGPFPFTAPVAVDATLAAVAASAVREGCLAETLGAHLALVAAELAAEPEVKAALSALAAEEARHAVLSFRIVAWALRTGGGDVETSVRAAFAAPWPRADVAELALRANVDVTLLQKAADEGVRDVLEPARDLLFAA